MKSLRILAMLLCCIVSWSCSSVYGIDEFNAAKCPEARSAVRGTSRSNA